MLLRILLLGVLGYPAFAFAQDVGPPVDAGQNAAILDARELLNRAGPVSGSPRTIADGYVRRVRAARLLGDSDRERAEIDAGLALLGSAVEGLRLRVELVNFHSDRGNATGGLAAWDGIRRVAVERKRADWEHLALASMAGNLSSLGKLVEAKRATQQMSRIQAEQRKRSDWSRFERVAQSQLAWANGAIESFSGHLSEAVASYEACLTQIAQHQGGRPRADGIWAFISADCSSMLLATLLRQGRLTDAGTVAANYRAFIDAYATAQKRPGVLSRNAISYAWLAMEQGHLDLARNTIAQARERLRLAKAPPRSSYVSRLVGLHGRIAMLAEEWQNADAIYGEHSKVLGDAGASNAFANADWAYALVRLGRTAESVSMIRGVVARAESLYDANSINLWESRAFLGVALAAAGERNEAMSILSVAIPRMISLATGERSGEDSGLMQSRRLGWLLDGYLLLLAEMTMAGDAVKVDPVDIAFRMADLARGSSVQRALSASASRATVSDSALADLVRKEQDLQREISGLADAIGNLLSRGRVLEQDAVVNDMRRNLAALRAAHASLSQELDRRYPEYAGLIHAKPQGISDIQKFLKAGESLISVYVGRNRTLIWAIPARGDAAFAVSRLDTREVAARVTKLRAALDPAGNLKDFDFATAHELYRELLAPVTAGWEGAKELIVVPHGALGSLPFSVLTTAPFSPAKDALAYAGYAEAPWLLKKVAISQLPAALSIAALRGARSVTRAGKPFLGYGDPVFAESPAGAPAASRNARLVARRNLEVRATEVQRNDIAGQADFTLLPALPDTAAEIEGIARVLNAETGRDVFLQKRASETNVKRGDIADYRVVMFATHGLVPGEMPGLYQPALALSNPALTGEKEDGFLLMEEILSLKLNADWVVLSACNTASASGQGGEAVSGLGRAFFYAGAKALLVSSWPVETVSARLLTTDIFQRQAGNASLTRSQALREASLGLMGRRSHDYSYAHPLFWAPFVIVGDGG